MNDEGNLEDSKSDGKNAPTKNQKPKETTYGKVTKTNRSQSIRYKKIQGNFQIHRHMELFFDDEEQSPLKGIIKNKTNKELLHLEKMLAGKNAGTKSVNIPSRDNGRFFSLDLPAEYQKLQIH